MATSRVCPRSIIGLAAITLAAGCDASRGDPASLSAAPVNGRAIGQIQGGDDDPEDANVVVIWNAQLEEYCSGSLLAPNLVLTAAHCVADTVSAGQTCADFEFSAVTEPSNLLVSAAAVAPHSTLDYEVAQEVIALPEPGSSVCGADLALILLDTALEGIAPLVPRIDQPTSAGETFAAVGYGGVDGAASEIGTRRRLDGLTVACTEACDLPYWALPEWVGNPAVAHTGGRPGDSGSPALDAQGRVIGVFNRHREFLPTSEVPDILLYGSPAGAAEWLSAGAVHAAEVLGDDPQPWATGWPTDPAYSLPIGGPCDDDCASGVCDDETCTRLCSDAAPCPQRYACEPDAEGRLICASANGDPPAAKDPEANPPAAEGCSSAARPPASSALVGLAALTLVSLLRRKRRVSTRG